MTAGMSAIRRMEGLLRSLADFFRRKEEPDDIDFLIGQIERCIPALYGREGTPGAFVYHPASLKSPLPDTHEGSLDSADYELIQSMNATRRELHALLYSSCFDSQEGGVGLPGTFPPYGGRITVSVHSLEKEETPE